MTGLDLTGVQRAVRGWLVDDLAVWRDGGVSDDTLDPDTLLLIDNEPVTVWTGLGAVQPLGTSAIAADPNVARVVEETGARFRALVDLDADVVAVPYLDILTVTKLNGPSADKRLEGVDFRVVSRGEPSSFAAVQFIYLRPLGDDVIPAAEPAPGEPLP